MSLPHGLASFALVKMSADRRESSAFSSDKAAEPDASSTCSAHEGSEVTFSTSSSDESFYEITTSEAESQSTTGEEDTELVALAIEQAASSPSKTKSMLDPVERSSLLFLDKEMIGNEGNKTR